MSEIDRKRRRLLRTGVLGAGWLALGRGVLGCAESETQPGQDASPSGIGCPSHWSDTSAASADAAVSDLDAAAIDAAAVGDVFQHGVASGDPLPDAVILWTRISQPSIAARVEVSWEIALDPEFERQEQSGVLVADRERDFTVKIDVRGLDAGSTYYYRFHALGQASPIGRTRTAPVGSVEQLRFGVVTCSSKGHGYFHAYAALAARLDLDAVLHLGDYLYEYKFGEWGVVREYQPLHEITTLADYRIRHADYKTDPDLQEVHRQHVFIVVWDDHEVANDSYRDGALNHMPDEGSWQARKLAALRAYNEWMPIRERDCGRRVWRRLEFGDLMDLIMLDTRHWGRNREEPMYRGPVPAPDPQREVLGADQEEWLTDQLADSRARWKVIGQQVMVADLLATPDVRVNLDQWHAYPEARLRLLDLLRKQPDGNVVVLTGDVHNAWANELADDPAAHNGGEGSVAVEFVTPSVTSPNGVQVDPELNPEIRWTDTWRHGYMVVDVSHARVQAAFCLLDAIEEPTRPAETVVAWAVEHGQRVLVSDAEPAPAKAAPPAAP